MLKLKTDPFFETQVDWGNTFVVDCPYTTYPDRLTKTVYIKKVGSDRPLEFYIHPKSSGDIRIDVTDSLMKVRDSINLYPAEFSCSIASSIAKFPIDLNAFTENGRLYAHRNIKNLFSWVNSARYFIGMFLVFRVRKTTESKFVIVGEFVDKKIGRAHV